MDVPVCVAVCRLASMAVNFALNLNRHKEKAPVPYPTLGDHVTTELLHVAGSSLEDGDFHATFVIKMKMKC